MLGSMLIALGVAMQPAPGKGPLDWMVGDWSCHDAAIPAGGPIAYDEYWTLSSRGLTGVGRMRQRFTRSLEHMRIAPDAAGRLTFYGAPNGAEPVAFPLLRSGPAELVFENAAHDFPQRIRYVRNGEELVATISLADGSQPQSWRYVRLDRATPETRCRDEASLRAP